MSHNILYSRVGSTDGDSAEVNTQDFHGRSPSKTSRVQRSLIVQVLGLSLTAIIFFSAGVFSSRWKSTSISVGETPGMKEPSSKAGYEKLVPPFPLSAQEYVFDKAFTGLPDAEVEAKWATMIPKGRGWVRLPFINEYGSDVYNIAVYHEIHCLFFLWHSYFDLLAKSSSSITSTQPFDSADLAFHAKHCFEYIRNDLTCNVDITPEPFNPNLNTTVVWGVKHQCQNFEEVNKWATMVRSSDEEGIGSFPDATR